jgi:hypothetical protein
LAAVKAERQRLTAAREQRNAEREAAEALPRQELALADDKAQDEAEAKHGALGAGIRVVETDLGRIILKRPHAAMYKRFADKSSIETDDIEPLVRHCLVHPSVGQFDAIMEVLPATMLRCADQIALLAGVRLEKVTGK